MGYSNKVSPKGSGLAKENLPTYSEPGRWPWQRVSVLQWSFKDLGSFFLSLCYLEAVALKPI